MSGEDEIERKADPDAEDLPMNDSMDDPDADKALSGSGRYLADLDVDGPTVARVFLAVLLFGGVILAFIGAGLWVEDTLGTYPTMVVTGLGSIVLSYLLAQVYARRGWI